MHIFLLKNMKQTPGSPTDRLWLALPCSFLCGFMTPRGISYFFLGTHAGPASLVSLREFRFSSAGWCGSGVRIAPTLRVLSGGYNKDMYCHPRFRQIMILFYNIQIMVLVQKSFFLLAFHLLHFHSHP